MESENQKFVQDGQVPVPRKSKGKRAVIGFVLLLLLVAVAGYGYYYFSETKSVEDELTAYAILQDNEDVSDYEDYLQRFPEGEHVEEVRERLEQLQHMYMQWRDINVGGHQRDFELFMTNYPSSVLCRQCEVKIDSLDWVDALADGSEKAIKAYLEKHPDGRYVSEAEIAHEKIADSTASVEEKLYIEQTLDGFYRAFGNNDEAAVFSYITPVMTRFLSKTDVTKADVSDLIARTYTEHIQSCKFVINNDYVVKKTTTSDGDAQYTVSFSVDQYIVRDNEGKTFGSYTAEAVLTAQYKICSLVMTSVSHK